MSASKSLRAPFQGYVWFDIPVSFHESDKAQQSEKLQRKYDFFYTSFLADWKPAEYRYEFDLGNEVPELRRALWNPHIGGAPGLARVVDFTPYEPSPNGECWDKVASSPNSSTSK